MTLNVGLRTLADVIEKLRIGEQTGIDSAEAAYDARRQAARTGTNSSPEIATRTR
ncbi:hypothetical protein [Streptomyces griseorubiginosus]|uniref:hypothetical protein n=1 Tax=Streptomyces griseorubiginosus TaxID=67304 RepID=UPI0036E55D35